MMQLKEVNKSNCLKQYSIQVSGIKCTNCAGKIERGLPQHIKDGLSKVSVNIIHEKVNIAVENDQVLSKAMQVLKNINFPPIGEPVLISGGDEAQRIVTFVYQLDSQSQKLQCQVKQMVGIVKMSHSIDAKQLKLTVTYNCQLVKGRQIADLIASRKPQYKVINHRVASFQGTKNIIKNQPSMIVTGLLCAFFLIFNMFLPFTGQWFMEILTFPNQFGIITVSVILNSILAFYVMFKYGQNFLRNAFINYRDFRQTNMETLIALGSVSAFCLYFFFVVLYTMEDFDGEIDNLDEAVMQINDALTSASIIVLVVTIGKHLENRIKKKIERITDSIFPESTLFSDMSVQFLQLKNRKLMIKDRRTYDITLLQKNDVINLKEGSRLLVDVTVLSGQIKAIQSAVNGSEQIQIVKKGGRIQSGSIIKENNQALVQIENVFQKSILTEIGTQIKLAQNQQEGGKSGIQQLCKTIASYFVKGVILLSILTMSVWTILLQMNFVTVPICNVCWIVQRGIGVLVASCPCALGLAVPSVVAIILNLATKSGILIRNNGVFEMMKKTKVISFDKTGTLFTRIQKIQQYVAFNNSQLEENNKWEIVSLIEKQIKHPLAEILYRQSFNRSGVTGTNYNYLLLGKPEIDKNGLIASVCNKVDKVPFQVLIGNKNLLHKFQVKVPKFDKKTDASTQLFLSVDGGAQMVIILNTHSNLRPQAKNVIQKIQKLGKQVHILSGDSRESVEKLADYLDIPHNCLHPQQSAFMKMEWIKQVQNQDKNGVLMVGDGLNDIPCLQEAAIGVSINAKSELNIHAAKVVILSENLHKILALIRLIQRGNQFIIINLFWAFTYNIVMMPVVAGVFYPLGFYISPVWSSIAMSLSSIIVVLFAQLLMCFDYDDSLKSRKNEGSTQNLSVHDIHQQKQSVQPIFGQILSLESQDRKRYQQFNDQV